MKWENLTSLEFDEAIEKSGGVCLLPLGSLEKHGDHIVVGCDALNAHHVANKAAELEYAVVFPNALWMSDMIGCHAVKGEQTKSLQRRGIIAISPRLLEDAMAELCEEIHRNGFRKILIINNHGGNTPFLNYFIRAQGYEKRDYATMWTWANRPINDPKLTYEIITSRPQDFPLTEEELATLKRFAETGYGGGHGDFHEVALAMGQTLDYVRPDKFDSLVSQSNHSSDYLSDMGVYHGSAWSANHPSFFSGYPAFGCTQNIGKAYAQLCAERLAGVIKTLKEDEFCVKLAQKAE